MGTKNNVNPNHYKRAGRERQGEDIVQEIHKQEYAQAEAARKRQSAGEANFLPGAAPVGEDKPHDDTQQTQTNEVD